MQSNVNDSEGRHSSDIENIVSTLSHEFEAMQRLLDLSSDSQTDPQGE